MWNHRYCIISMVELTLLHCEEYRPPVPGLLEHLREFRKELHILLEHANNGRSLSDGHKAEKEPPISAELTASFSRNTILITCTSRAATGCLVNAKTAEDVQLENRLMMSCDPWYRKADQRKLGSQRNHSSQKFTICIFYIIMLENAGSSYSPSHCS